MERRKVRTQNERMLDIASELGEQFSDYVVIGRIRGGVVWGCSDRSFAIGAMARIIEQIRIEEGFNDGI